MTLIRVSAPLRRLLGRSSQKPPWQVPTGRIQAIGVDVDQCLTTTGERQTRIHRQALAMARIQAYNAKCLDDPTLPKMFLVSGRDVRYGLAIAFMFGVHDWCIAEYGGVFYHPISGDIITNKVLAPGTYLAFQEVRRIAEQLPKDISALRLYGGKSVMVTLERDPGSRVSMDILLGMVRSQIGHLEEQGFITILASQIAVDILPRGIDKGVGLTQRYETGLTLIHPSHTLYIDDSGGGKAAAQVAGLAGSPSNGDPKYRGFLGEIGGIVSKLPLREGVVEIIKRSGIKI